MISRFSESADTICDQLVARLQEWRAGRSPVVVFAGAGISAGEPSSRPLGKQLQRALVEVFVGHASEEDQRQLKASLDDLTLEEVASVLHEWLGDQIMEAIEGAVDAPSVPVNRLHRLLASLLLEGHIVITTNFDHLIERAYKDIAGHPLPSERVHYDAATFASLHARIPDIPEAARGHLLKIHGTFAVPGLLREIRSPAIRCSVVGTLERVALGLAPTVRKVFEQLLKTCPLLVLGYSASDLDVVPVLNLVESAQPLIWINHNNDDRREFLSATGELEARLIELQHERNCDSRMDWSTYNRLTILHGRSLRNARDYVYLINGHSERLMERLLDQVPKVPSPNWEEPIRLLGKTNRFHREACLASLAQTAECWDIAEPHCEALARMTKDSRYRQYRSRARSLLGWNQYRQGREKSAMALANYQEALRMRGADPAAPRRDVERARIESLIALTHRVGDRLQDAGEALRRALGALSESLGMCVDSLSPNTVLAALEVRGLLPDFPGDCSAVADILTRAANFIDATVSNPVTESIALLKSVDVISAADKQRLQRALSLAKAAVAVRKQLGDLRALIQSEHFVGLVSVKLGSHEDVKRAISIHSESKDRAYRLGWFPREYAQACRNLGLALETIDPERGALELKEANKYFRSPADKSNAEWHRSRLLIRVGQQRRQRGRPNYSEPLKEATDTLKSIVKVASQWHARCNALAFLSIALVEQDRFSEAEQCLGKMVSIYELVMNEQVHQLLQWPYGVSNAIANVSTVHFLASDRRPEIKGKAVKLMDRLQSIRMDQTWPL